MRANRILALLLLVLFAGIGIWVLGGPTWPLDGGASLAFLAVIGLWLLGGHAWDRSRWEARARSIAEMDLFGLPHFLWFLPLYLGVRWSLLTSGSYGLDTDAWRLARSATELWNEGIYERSRPPGNPVVEIGLSLVTPHFGPLGGNLLSAALGLFAIWCFDRLLRQLHVPLPALAALALALSPVMVINTANTMDYAWALAATMAATLAAARGRWALAGALMGLSVGCRVASVVHIGVLVGWGLLGRRASWGRLLLACLSFGLVVALAYTPVIHAYGWEFLQHANPPFDLSSIHKEITAFTGRLPWLGWGLLIADGLRRATPAAEERPGMLALFAAGAAIAVFSQLPIEGAYLLPALPFLLLLGARVASAPAMLALCLLMGLSTRVELPDRAGEGRGAVLTNLERVERNLEPLLDLERASLPDGALILGGQPQDMVEALVAARTERAGPPFQRRGRIDPAHDIIWIGSVPKTTFDAAVSAGRTIFVLGKRTDRYIQQKEGYSPLAQGALVIGADIQRSRATEEISAPAIASGEIRALARDPSLLIDLDLPKRIFAHAPSAEQKLAGPFVKEEEAEGITLWSGPLPLRGGSVSPIAPPADLVILDPDGQPMAWVRHDRVKGRVPSWSLRKDTLLLRLPTGEPPPDGRFRLVAPFAAAADQALDPVSAQAPDASFAMQSIEWNRWTRTGLYLPAPARVDFDLRPAAGAVLAFEANLLTPAIDAPPPSDGAVVVAEVDDGKVRVELGRVELEAGRPKAVSWSLKAFADREIRVRLSTEGGAGWEHDLVLLAHPAVYVPQPAPPRVVLVLVEGLRSDHMATFGYDRVTTPNIDQWAKRAVAFEVDPAGRSLEAILGGTPGEGAQLPGELASQGWLTLGASSADEDSAVGQGWDQHRVRPNGADQAAKDLADWLHSFGDRKLVAMLRASEAAPPLRAPRALRGEFGGGDPPTPELRVLDAETLAGIAPTDAVGQAYALGSYDECLLAVDGAFGTLLAALGPNDAVALVGLDPTALPGAGPAKVPLLLRLGEGAPPTTAPEASALLKTLLRAVEPEVPAEGVNTP